MDKKELERAGQLEAQQRQAELEAQKGNPHFQAEKQWGGQRKGAGRKAETIRIGKKFAVRAGQAVQVNSWWPDGQTMVRRAVVELNGHSRNRIIRLRCDDGEVIVIAMMS